MKLYTGPSRSSKNTTNTTAEKKEKKATPLPKRSILFKFFFRFISSLFITGVVVISCLLLWFAKDLPDLNNLAVNTRKPSVIVQTHDGTILGTYGDLYEDMLMVSDLPPYVPHALMAVEDRRFYYHFGVDFFGLIRAAYTNYKAKRVVQGGSTLTQQLAKNLLQAQGLFGVNDRSYKRKIQEVLLSLWLEWKFTKDQILTMYLNRVYFGAGTYGIDAAARKYFNKSARNLTVFESAVIAGVLKAPSRYSPAQNPKRALERAKIVLQLMQEAGFLDNTESYIKQGEAEIAQLQITQGQGAKYFADWVYETLPSIIGSFDKDIVVITTLDPQMQHHAELVCSHYNQTMGKELKASQVAFLAMSPIGAIRAMVGGRNYMESQFNRVTQSLRQPGSAFKLFIYLAALERGLTPDSMVSDLPVELGNWKPKNYKWVSRGEISLREAFSNSVNACAIRLALETTPSKMAELTQRLGATQIDSKKLSEGASYALGTVETTLLEMTQAYATFAHNGNAVWAYGIQEVRDKEGNILFRHNDMSDKKIINDTVLSYMRQLLRGVIESGSGRAANIDTSVYGKTGSNGDKDAWFFGFRDQYESSQEGFASVVVGVWAGNDSNSPMAKLSTGGRIPTRIAAAFLSGPNTKLLQSPTQTTKGASPEQSAKNKKGTIPEKSLPADFSKKENKGSLDQYLKDLN